MISYFNTNISFLYYISCMAKNKESAQVSNQVEWMKIGKANNAEQSTDAISHSLGRLYKYSEAMGLEPPTTYSLLRMH